MEEVCEWENCKAVARVNANKGSAGVDGMSVHELPEFLKQHWPAPIREQLLSDLQGATGKTDPASPYQTSFIALFDTRRASTPTLLRTTSIHSLVPA
jgi:hypothetical protein